MPPITRNLLAITVVLRYMYCQYALELTGNFQKSTNLITHFMIKYNQNILDEIND